MITVTNFLILEYMEVDSLGVTLGSVCQAALNAKINHQAINGLMLLEVRNYK